MSASFSRALWHDRIPTSAKGQYEIGFTALRATRVQPL